jgi:hypothetical protein
VIFNLESQKDDVSLDEETGYICMHGARLKVMLGNYTSYFGLAIGPRSVYAVIEMNHLYLYHLLRHVITDLFASSPIKHSQLAKRI